MQVDVERVQIEEREIEKLGRGKVDVGEQAVGRGRLGIVVQVAQEVLHADAPVPPDDAWRNLVAEREREDCRMVGEFGHAGDNVAPDASREAPVVEKSDVLEPRQAHHDAKAVPRRFVEQVAPRRRIRADGVDAEGRHHPEVFGDALRTGELVAVCVRRKRSVRDAFDEKALAPGAQKFPVRGDPSEWIGCRTGANSGADLNGCAHNEQLAPLSNTIKRAKSLFYKTFTGFAGFSWFPGFPRRFRGRTSRTSGT